MMVFDKLDVVLPFTFIPTNTEAQNKQIISAKLCPNQLQQRSQKSKKWSNSTHLI